MAAFLPLLALFGVAWSGCNLAPGLQYASFAYNIMYGNPLITGGFDPGFTKAIFDLNQCSNGQQWRDINGRVWDVPDGATMADVATCTMDQSYSAMSGANSYSNSLSESASVKTKANDVAWKAKFSASTDYQKVHSYTSNEASVSISSYAKCGVYEIELQTPYAGPALSANFRSYIENMPTAFNKDPDFFWNFIDVDYGTHYLSQLENGGRYGIRSEFTSYSYSSFKSSNLNIQTAAKYSTAAYGGSAKSMTDSEQSQAKAYDSAAYQHEQFFVGGYLPSNGNASTWQETLSNEPMPMYYKLEGIASLLNSYNFPEIDPDVLTQKYNALMDALQHYCNYVKNISVPFGYDIQCDGYPDDPPLPSGSIFGGMYTPTQKYVNPYTQQYNCPNNFDSIHVARYYVTDTIYNDTFLCVNKSQDYVDAMDYFGGIYVNSNPDFQSNGIPNKFTGNYSCPAGFARTWSAIGGSGPTNYETCQHYCYNASMPTQLATVGGFYVVNRNNVPCDYPINNPYTNAASCPVGFTAYPTMDFCCMDTQEPGHHCGTTMATQYVCLSNIYT